MPLPAGLLLAPCDHKMGGASACPACQGSGYVAVIPSLTGNSMPCQHAWSNGNGAECNACLGSGWAGRVDLSK